MNALRLVGVANNQTSVLHPDRSSECLIVGRQARKHTLALELGRLDELQEVFYRQAKAGDVPSVQAVTKIIKHRCVFSGCTRRSNR
jgi:hypothetical protein